MDAPTPAVIPIATLPVALPVAALWLALAGPALAQTTVTRSETVPTGKQARLVIVPNLKKDCSLGPMPEIKVTTAPGSGSLITKAGKLKTPAKYRCPNKEAEVQALFYQSKDGYTGSDSVVVEIKNADGEIEKRDIRITVDKADKAKKDTTDL